MSTCIELCRPIDGKTADLLARLAGTAHKMGAKVLLVGAFAREVLFYHQHGIETGISTMDTDISVHVADWAAFHRLREALARSGFQTKDDPVEKIVDTGSGQEVDLIPFGPIAGADARLVWPNEGPTWNVLGIQEALASALSIPLPHHGTGGSSAEIPVVTIASLVMLKIVSFYDRPKERVRDVRDIGFVIRHYLDAGNRERLMKHTDLVTRAARDPDAAAAILLGKDIGLVASEATRNYIVDRLRQELTSSSACPLAHTLARRSCNGSFSVARSLLRSLIEGLEAFRREKA